MKIDKIKINSYGKFKNLEINFGKNLNIIYGKNESGKSTLLKFIVNSLYGISKSKKGKDISDYEKYKPWVGEEFSGKLSYELDDLTKYEIYRDFNKKNPEIYGENGKIISDEFNIDKFKGNEFFIEQTQISEEMFLATSISMQQDVRVDKNMQNSMIQKISNLVDTGEDNISYKTAIDKLNKVQLEKVGSERSREKPINIIKRNIAINDQNIKDLKPYEGLRYEIEDSKKELENKLAEKEELGRLLKEVKILDSNSKMQSEKIKIQNQILEDNFKKIEEIKNKINNINKNLSENDDEKNNYENKKINRKLFFIGIFVLIINILFILAFNLIFKQKFISYLVLITIPIYLVYFLFEKNKFHKRMKLIKESEKRNNERIENEQKSLISEKEIYQKNIDEIKNEINQSIEKNKINQSIQEKSIIERYGKNIDIGIVNRCINEDNVEDEIEKNEDIITNIKLELNKLEFQKQHIEPELENLVTYVEKAESLKKEFENLEKYNQSIELAKKLLEKAYEKMKNNVSPIFAGKLCQNINNITNGKYKKLIFNDEQGLLVESENGNYISAERLSIGTIDQLYLSLRLAMLDEISNEKVPIILDEAFAYYDTERLKNLLVYLSEKFSDRQIIIFTCTKRENEILENLNIEYNKILL